MSHQVTRATNYGLKIQTFESFVVKISRLHLYPFKNRKRLLTSSKAENMTQNQTSGLIGTLRDVPM